MKQEVLHQMMSPFDRHSSVLTLGCGHLWSWNSPEPPPFEIDCIHCDKPPSAGLFLDAEEMKALDEAVRKVRVARFTRGRSIQ